MARKKVHMLPAKGHKVYLVRFLGEHVGAIASPPHDRPRLIIQVDGEDREVYHHEMSTGEARRNDYDEPLLCRNEPQHFIKEGAYYTVEDEEPVCAKCRPFEVLAQL